MGLFKSKDAKLIEEELIHLVFARSATAKGLALPGHDEEEAIAKVGAAMGRLSAAGKLDQGVRAIQKAAPRFADDFTRQDWEQVVDAIYASAGLSR